MIELAACCQSSGNPYVPYVSGRRRILERVHHTDNETLFISLVSLYVQHMSKVCWVAAMASPMVYICEPGIELFFTAEDKVERFIVAGLDSKAE